MKILLIGDNPNLVGGVVNYTRPLAEELTKKGHEVYYFCSGSFNKKYNLLLKPYIKESKKDGYTVFELINPPTYAFNYDNLERDIENDKLDRIFENLIKKINPDVVHIHEMIGLSVSTIKIIKKYNIPLYRTIHIYWHLCPKRVMIDSNGALCEGPQDINKCSKCIKQISYKNDKKKIILKNMIDKNKWISVKIKKIKNKKERNSNINVNKTVIKNTNIDIKHIDLLRYRLNENVDLLNNYFDKVICVSNDVKNTLIRYGVKSDKLLVQHIGSTIAKNQTTRVKETKEKIVFANIGGVNHYKGSEILLKSFNNVDKSKYELKVFGWYDEKYVNKIMNECDINVEFKGAYKQSDLMELLKDVDIMILPSICKDTAPQTIFESFSCGIPIIASNAGGFPDFIENGVNGLLFEQANIKELKKCINLILKDNSLISRYRSNIKKLKTIEQNADELINIYKMI